MARALHAVARGSRVQCVELEKNADQPACLQVPWERKYLAGWGYVLSRDVAKYIAATVLRYERFPSSAPGWWRGLHWEDVMVGLLAGDYIGEQPAVRPRPGARALAGQGSWLGLAVAGKERLQTPL